MNPLEKSLKEDERIEPHLTCSRCGNDFKIAPLVTGCPVCAEEGRLEVLQVAYRLSRPPRPPWKRRKISGFGKFADLLPGGDPEHRVFLGEGGTPLVRSKAIGPRLGLQNLYFKNESSNPTWSFKDRYVSVSVNVAKSLGFKKTVVSSTGNLGVSAAAYSAAAGMQCLFVAPPGTSPSILAQARLHGAAIVITPREGRHRVVESVAGRHGWFPIALFMPMPIHNPFGVEGYRTIAYEIIEDLAIEDPAGKMIGAAPAAVLFPCARGNGLFGTWKGFKEAKDWAWSDRLPKMIGCQPIGANSLEESLRCGKAEPVSLPPYDSVAFSTSETVADAHALAAIKESNGAAVSASEEEILTAVHELGKEGLYVEAASALPVACLPKLIGQGIVSLSDSVVCVLTAAGIKWPDLLPEATSSVAIDSTPEAVERFLSATFPDRR